MKKQKKLLVTTPKKGEIGKSIKLSKQERKTVKEIVEADVHTEHCCLKHGCKYGYELLGKADQCSVVSGKKKQSYDCEECESDKLYYTPATFQELMKSFNLTKKDKEALKNLVFLQKNKSTKSLKKKKPAIKKKVVSQKKKIKVVCRHKNLYVIDHGQSDHNASSGYCIRPSLKWCTNCGTLLISGSTDECKIPNMVKKMMKKV